MEFFRGGEIVLEQFCLLFPGSPISVLTYEIKALSEPMQRHEYSTGWIHRFPKMRTHFRKLLPVFPELIRGVRVPEETRFVLSSDASMIKGARIPDSAIHVCYCHSPARYIWGLEGSYLDAASVPNWLARWVFDRSVPRLRRFDRAAAQRVTHFIANSRCVQERIKRCYDRDSVVIHPPVHVARFDPTRPRGHFFLIVSALVPYKRIDLAVDACSRLGCRLIVIGTGPEETVLRRRAASCVEFLGWQSNESVREYYERCRAFLFPGIEDFGITPCEAQAAGAPVIAYGEGGALETVRDGVSGLFFHQQTVESLANAISDFESRGPFSPAVCRANVEHLNPVRFRRQIQEFVSSACPEIFSGYQWPDADRLESSVDFPDVPVAVPTHSVLHVVEPGIDGVFRHVAGLTAFQRANGLRVHLAYSDRRGGARMDTLAGEIRRGGGTTKNLRITNVPEFRDLIALFKLVRLIRRLRPDVIHAHSSKAGALARVATLAAPWARCVYTPHAYYGLTKGSVRRVWLYNWAERLLGRIGTTINISEDEARFGATVLKLKPDEQRVINNPVDTQRFQPPTVEERAQARAHFSIPEGAVVLATIGRTCWQKDPETAYEAVAHVTPHHPDLLFLHLGSGDWHSYLGDLARKRGFADQHRFVAYQDEPLPFYHAIDALLSTSRYEAGWSLVALEALACNLPVIASRCPGMSDFGHAGLSDVWTFAPEDVSGCTQALTEWLKALGEDRPACNHRQVAEERFSVDRLYGAVLEAYRPNSSADKAPSAAPDLVSAGNPARRT